MYSTVVDVATVAAHLVDDNWRVVDCRFVLADVTAGRRAWLDGHIPGAVFADLEEDLSGETGPRTSRHPLPDAAQVVAVMSWLGIDADVQVVPYDDVGGGFAARLWWLLRYYGHEAVAVLDGGIQAWTAAGHGLVSGEETATPRRFVGAPHPGWVVDGDAVAAMDTTARALVDSRDAARYRGEVEPLDPVAGRIPGARNRPWQANLGEDGRLKPAETIAAEMAALLDGAAPGEAVFYCGSGVTGAFNVLNAMYAGLPQPKLYAGSYSEWSRTPGRPIAQG